MQKYTTENFKEGTTLFQVTQGGSDDEQTIEISCHNYKLDAFWSGEWLTTFTIKAGVLSGDLKIKCHYFEQGNMQFNLDK